jgi:hypothetical protein
LAFKDFKDRENLDMKREKRISRSGSVVSCKKRAVLENS